MAKQFPYTVRGHWPFPLDMLRHDCSRAASEDDQAAIDRLSGDFAPDRDVFEDVEINLIAAWKPRTERWESFGWSVPSDLEHEQMRAWRRRDAERAKLMQSALAKLTDSEREALEWHAGRTLRP